MDFGIQSLGPGDFKFRALGFRVENFGIPAQGLGLGVRFRACGFGAVLA